MKIRFKRDNQKMGAHRSQVELIESSALEAVFDSSVHGSTKLSDPLGDPLILYQSG